MPRTVKAYEDPVTGQVYKTAKEAVEAENKLDQKKLAQLKRRIKSGKYWVPKVGEYVYTDTRMSIDHGWDDVCGGLSTVTRVYESMSGGDKTCKFIEIAQHERGGNWTQFLYSDQAKLMKRFGNNWAYPDPDYVTQPESWPL